MSRHSRTNVDERDLERGPQGDHGQQGDPGVIGLAGTPGAAGAVGAVGQKGDTGPRGPAAEKRWYSLTDRRLLAIFGIVVLTGVLFIQGLSGVVSDLADQQKALEAQQKQIVTNCQKINKGIVRQNALIDEAIAAERKKDRPDADRINGLIRFKLPVTDCVPPKKP